MWRIKIIIIIISQVGRPLLNFGGFFLATSTVIIHPFMIWKEHSINRGYQQISSRRRRIHEKMKSYNLAIHFSKSSFCSFLSCVLYKSIASGSLWNLVHYDFDCEQWNISISHAFHFFPLKQEKTNWVQQRWYDMIPSTSSPKPSNAARRVFSEV